MPKLWRSILSRFAVLMHLHTDSRVHFLINFETIKKKILLLYKYVYMVTLYFIADSSKAVVLLCFILIVIVRPPLSVCL